MPLTDVQERILRILAVHRSPDSYVAGATVHLDETSVRLGDLAWAACGKDPGFTPDFLLEQAARHVAYRQEDLDRLQLAHPMDVRDLKVRWLAALEAAQSLVARLPPAEVGCLYLNASGDPVTPDPDAASFPALRRHVGRVRGAWPTVG